MATAQSYLSPTDIGQLFTDTMPAYECEATRMADGSIALQFTNLANHELITLRGISVHELGSVSAIAQLGKSLSEEFAVAIAQRRM
ncbi:hypothetical protein [Pseudomonas sp. LRF_L74]|uniref:hypothetical protein n=1 Tax=Pseudomonas sp. LRF_L74 TaxID=3369422 RepID=UPI003F62C988